MFPQDVTDTSPAAAGEYGLNAFLVAPQTRDGSAPRSAQVKDGAQKDLMFFLTRSYRTLTYSDGGD